MTSTALAVIPGQIAVRHTGTDVATEDEEWQERTQEDPETLEEIVEQIKFLESRLTYDTERSEAVAKYCNEKNGALIAQVELANAKLEMLTEALGQGDLEDQANADDAAKALKDFYGEDDTTHETDDNALAADVDAIIEAANAARVKKRCSTIYKAIAGKTHPDKCRKMTEAKRAHMTKYFMDAQVAYLELNCIKLEDIYEQVFGKPYDQVNLMQRLVIARQRRDKLAKELKDLHDSDGWQLTCMAIRHGKHVAAEQYRMALENTLLGLNAMIDQLTSMGTDPGQVHYNWK